MESNNEILEKDKDFFDFLLSKIFICAVIALIGWGTVSLLITKQPFSGVHNVPFFLVQYYQNFAIVVLFVLFYKITNIVTEMVAKLLSFRWIAFNDKENKGKLQILFIYIATLFFFSIIYKSIYVHNQYSFYVTSSDFSNKAAADNLKRMQKDSTNLEKTIVEKNTYNVLLSQENLDSIYNVVTIFKKKYVDYDDNEGEEQRDTIKYKNFRLLLTSSNYRGSRGSPAKYGVYVVFLSKFKNINPNWSDNRDCNIFFNNQLKEEFKQNIQLDTLQDRKDLIKVQQGIKDKDNEKMGYLDFLYFSTITMTTVGFGDIIPGNTLVRNVVSFQCIINIFLIGFALNFSGLFSNKKEENDKEIED